MIFALISAIIGHNSAITAPIIAKFGKGNALLKSGLFCYNRL